jgi:hypothetical protein
MGDNIYQAWKRGGSLSEGIEIKDNQTLLIKSADARLCRLILNPHEIGLLSLQFNFLTEEATDQTNYTFHVIQTDYETDDIIGGEVYQIIKQSAPPPFEADAGEDIYADKGETVLLCAVPVSESVLYSWYNQNGDLIHEGKEFEITVTKAEKYLLKVISPESGYTDCAEVWIRLKPDRIESLFPNPASGEITVSCKINEAENASVSISNYYFTTVSDNYMLEVDSQSKTLYVNNYPAGLYVITLVCDGVVTDTKTFIKQ